MSTVSAWWAVRYNWATWAACADSSKALSLKAIEQVLTGWSLSPAIIATMALESTPPDRKAPSGTSATRRMRTASRRRSINSPWASRAVMPWCGLNGTSQ